MYHRLQYLLPGESVKMADMTRSGVSLTFFSKAFNECHPSKRKEFVFKCVYLLSMCVSLQKSSCMLLNTVKYCQLVLIKTTWTIEKCLFLHCLEVFPSLFDVKIFKTFEVYIGISIVCNGPDLNELLPKT